MYKTLLNLVDNHCLQWLMLITVDYNRLIIRID